MVIYLRMDLQKFTEGNEADLTEHIPFTDEMRKYWSSAGAEDVKQLQRAVKAVNGLPEEEPTEITYILQNYNARMICTALCGIEKQLERIADALEKADGGYDPYGKYDPSRCFMD